VEVLEEVLGEDLAEDLEEDFGSKKLIKLLSKLKFKTLNYENNKEVRKMPGFDGTGPLGEGPMTGGGFGYCGTGYGRGIRRGRGLGYGRGFGRGFGFRRAAWGAPRVNYSPEDELEMLRREKELLEQDIASLEKEINKGE
jgi:hypothetical protein